ncbi:CopL family metal-binding regulatory protein [Thalassotalea mangrovi]|uniref:CopL family metal-binding regulatory protein n=1 Tax=Thalassotalea mangrovi TaxID=2572245 RepID=A0A4U1BBN3_9GAMM|nr:CopL family metal-binding regulatory protein [Thalassotalea mangrovi]TKB47429.1 CopL family metal-binding regulatory protein [Thalassotalea mangrovi]
MPKISSIVVTVLLMLALLGQGFAYAAMACDMSRHDSHAQMESEKHAMHGDMHASHHSESKQADVTTDSAHSDCCMDECLCPATGCNNVVFLVFAAAQSQRPETHEKYSPAPPFFASLTHISLFRPPISA